MTAPILVTGGTGTLGRLVVPRLLDAGRAVRVLSRHPGDPQQGVESVSADLSTGKGVDAAVEGAEVVLHLAGSGKGDEVKARNLVDAANQAGVRHLVYISVVGADRIPVRSGIDRAMFGYFRSKLLAEEIVADSGIPWTTLRATQFHDLVFMTAQQMAKMPVVPAFAGVRFQPIDADEVAARLVDLTLGPPAGLVSEMGGPRAYEMKELVRDYLRAFGKHRPILSIKGPGGAARAVRSGANLALDRAVGRRTWEDFLAERAGAVRVASAPLRA